METFSCRSHCTKYLVFIVLSSIKLGIGRVKNPFKTQQNTKRTHIWQSSARRTNIIRRFVLRILRLFFIFTSGMYRAQTSISLPITRALHTSRAPSGIALENMYLSYRYATLRGHKLRSTPQPSPTRNHVGSATPRK